MTMFKTFAEAKLNKIHTCIMSLL